MKEFDNIHKAYLGVLNDIYENYDYRSNPRGMYVREKLDYQFRITNPVAEPIRTKDNKRNTVIQSYTEKEIELYNSCTRDVEDFAEASSFWRKIANPDGTVNSAYGFLIWANRSHGNGKFESRDIQLTEINGSGPGKIQEAVMRTPWEWCKESLVKDKNTRQAILRFSLPEHAWVGVKDFTCTMHGVFLIRDDKLHFSVNMRSNDLVLGLVYDMPWFISLMDKMIDELKPHYSNLEKGNYTHSVHSLHIYERDEEKVKRMLGLD